MSGFTFFYITAALTGLLILVTCGVWLRYDLRVLPVWRRRVLSAPAPAATVVALGEEPRLWNHWSSYTQVVQASPAGGFSLATRPGRLRLVALPRESFDRAFHREIDFDKLAPVGQPVTVGARETVRVALQFRSTAD